MVSSFPERSACCISRCHSCSFSASSWSSLGEHGARTGTGGHGLAAREMEAQAPGKPYLLVSMRRWQSCATSAVGACREGSGSAPVLGLVLSPELVLSCWGWLLGLDSLGGTGSLSLVSLVPPRQLAFSPRSGGQRW